MVASFEKYYLLFPVFVAFLSIFFVWLCIQWRRRQDGASTATTLDEDKSLTEEIKANFNPDAMSTSSGTHHDSKRNISEKCEEDTDPDEREVERRIQQEQLKQIFMLMERNKEKYGISSMEDVQEQMKRYKT